MKVPPTKTATLAIAIGKHQVRPHLADEVTPKWIPTIWQWRKRWLVNSSLWQIKHKSEMFKSNPILFSKVSTIHRCHCQPTKSLDSERKQFQPNKQGWSSRLAVPFPVLVKGFHHELSGNGKLPNPRTLAKPANKHIRKNTQKAPHKVPPQTDEEPS